MKTKKLLAVTGLALAAMSAASAASITWAKGFDAAVATAKTTHRLLMVDFYTDWCGWCKKLDKDTYEAPAIVSKSQGFVPIKLDAEKGGLAQAKKYHVAAFPTILFLKPSGEVVWKIEGYMPPADFAKQMEMAGTVEVKLPKLETEFKKSGGSPKLDADLLGYYGGQGRLDKVQEVLTALEKMAIHGDSSSFAAAFNSGGDAFQSAQKYPEAIRYFKLAEADGKPDQVAYARISMVQCYLGSNDVKNAKPLLESIVKMGPEADAYRKQAEAILSQISPKG